MTDVNFVFAIQLDLEICCGSRIGSGYHRQSIRLDLESKLKQRNLRKPGIFFKCKLGSRMGVEYHNAVACITYKDTLLECLDEQIEHLNEVELKKTKSKQIAFENRQNTRFHQMRDVILKNWRVFTMQCSVAILCWNVMIEPLTEIDSIKTSVRRVKELLTLADEKYQVIFGCDNDQFERLRRMNIRSECSQGVSEVLQHCEKQWLLATNEEKLQLDRMTERAFRSAYVKFRKDVDNIFAMADSDAIIPMTNKHQESFFSHYKRYEKHFLHMTDGMLELVAKAKLNKVTEQYKWPIFKETNVIKFLPSLNPYHSLNPYL